MLIDQNKDEIVFSQNQYNTLIKSTNDNKNEDVKINTDNKDVDVSIEDKNRNENLKGGRFLNEKSNTEQKINTQDDTSNLNQNKSVLQKLREKSLNRPQKIPPKQTDLQVLPSKLEPYADNKKHDEKLNQSNNNYQLKFNSNINIMKKQINFKSDENENNETILNTSNLNTINKNIPTRNSNTSLPISISKNKIDNVNESVNIPLKNELSHSNSGIELSAMEKHRLKMKDRRSVDKQIKLQNGTFEKHESKNDKINEDINAVLGYDE